MTAFSCFSCFSPSTEAQNKQLGTPELLALKQQTKATAGSPEVWECRDEVDGLSVDVQLLPRKLNAAARRKLLQVVSVHAQMHAHVNVARVAEVILTTTHIGLVREHTAGCTLQQYMEEHGVLNEDLACFLMRQLVAAVAHSHANNIAYRDIKLHEVLLDTSGQAPLLTITGFEDSGSLSTYTAPVVTINPLRTSCQPPMSQPTAPHTSAAPHNSTAVAGTTGVQPPRSAGAGSDGAGAGEPAVPAEPQPPSMSVSGGSAEAPAVQAAIHSLGAVMSALLYGHRPVEVEEAATSISIIRKLLQAHQLESPDASRHITLIAGKLQVSEDARSLLHQLVGRPQLSLRDITAHPWMQRKLPAIYEHALASMLLEQEDLDRLPSSYPLNPAVLVLIGMAATPAPVASTASGGILPSPLRKMLFGGSPQADLSGARMPDFVRVPLLEPASPAEDPSVHVPDYRRVALKRQVTIAKSLSSRQLYVEA